MKGLKCIITVLMMGTAVLSLAGCSLNVTENGISETINNSVTMPDQYSIAYEVESADGMIHTVAKSKDNNGNIYYQSENAELLFLSDGSNYVKYERDDNGRFVVSNKDVTYNSDYVVSATEKFMQYAEKSKEKFMPGMKNDGEQEKCGRTCLVYSVRVGIANTAVTYTFSVDKETGICLGWEESKKVAGNDIGADDEIFTCTEFITEDVPSLKLFLEK